MSSSGFGLLLPLAEVGADLIGRAHILVCGFCVSKLSDWESLATSLGLTFLPVGCGSSEGLLPRLTRVELLLAAPSTSEDDLIAGRV